MTTTGFPQGKLRTHASCRNLTGDIVLTIPSDDSPEKLLQALLTAGFADQRASPGVVPVQCIILIRNRPSQSRATDLARYSFCRRAEHGRCFRGYSGSVQCIDLMNE